MNDFERQLYGSFARMEKKQRGRPATGKTPARQLGRMSDEDYEIICRAAELLGQSRTAFMAETLLRRAKRVIREHDA